MVSPIKMVVFDMAGTTVNEDNVVYKTLHRVINEGGYPCTLEQVLAQGAGKEKRQAIVDVLTLQQPDMDDSVINRLFHSFLIALEAAYRDLPVSPQPGAEDIFQYLKDKGILVVLNTGYNQETAEGLIDKLGWKQGLHFDALITASQVQNGRPHPDMILLAKEKFNISDTRQIAKIGDSIVDIEEGQQANCGLNIGITTGAQTREQLLSANPDFVIDSLAALRSIIGGDI